MTQTAMDRRFLAAALRLGERETGRTWPNPAVGCLIVKNGKVVGAGATGQGGRPHGETVALADAAELARGATAYVSLEPCNHTGRTGPCTLALIGAGVSRVVIALGDPDHRVAGNGVKNLQASGIEVLFEPFNDLKVRAEQAHRGHLTRMRFGRPFVTLKLALSDDGAIGRIGQGQVAITNQATNKLMHARRSRSDAILVGSQTLVADDPQLSVRLPGLERTSPVAIVLGDAELDGKKLLIDRPSDRVIAVPSEQSHDVEQVLQTLGNYGLTSVLVEGGAKVARSFLNAGLVDELILLRGENPLGEGGIQPFDANPFHSLKAAGLGNWRIMTHRKSGSDQIVTLAPQAAR